MEIDMISSEDTAFESDIPSLNIEADNEENVSLSNNVLPETYEIYIFPHFDKGTFVGVTMIELQVTETTDKIVLHSKDLIYEKAYFLPESPHRSRKNERLYFIDPKMKAYPVEKIVRYKKLEVIAVFLEVPLDPGYYSMRLHYSGVLMSSERIGLFCYTTNPIGKSTHYCVKTHFEPKYARMAFPCFDDPKFKTKFRLRLVKPLSSRYIALSNARVDKTMLDYPPGGYSMVYFEDTIPIPTYLLSFVIGVFKKSSFVYTKSKVSVRVYARPQFSDLTDYVCDFAAKVLEYISEFLMIAYPCPKLDILALPNARDVVISPYGLITVREIVVFIEKGASTSDEYLQSVRLLSHDILHTWIGNLVSVNSWKDTWLYDGLTELISYKCGLEAFSWYGEWVYLKYNTLPALARDSWLSAKSLGNNPLPRECSLRKSASVLRMIHKLGEEGFSSAFRLFVGEYMYKTAKYDDFVSCLEVRCDWPVTDRIHSWIQASGFPLLTVSSVQDGYAVQQKRYSSNIHVVDLCKDFNHNWEVPVYYVTGDDPKKVHCAWLHGEQVIAINTKAKWIKLNWHGIGFYRVNYPTSIWQEYTDILMSNPLILDPEDRVSIISDVFALASSGYIQYSIPLTMLLYLKNGKEDNFLVWFIVYSNLKRLKTLLTFDEYFKSYVDQILLPLIPKLEWNITPSTPYMERKLNIEIIRIACFFEYEEVIDQIRNLYKAVIEFKDTELSADMTDIIHLYGMYGAPDEQLWSVTWSRYIAENQSRHILRSLKVLSSVHSTQLLYKLVEESKNPKLLRRQFFIPLLQLVADNPYGTNFIWDFIRHEWSYLIKRYGAREAKIVELFDYVTSNFTTGAKLAEVQAFYDDYLATSPQAVELSGIIENVHSNMAWIATYGKAVSDWLRYFSSKVGKQKDLNA